ncbi:hypothetical protein BRC94_01560 [Halobacteriales archaeon QS_5_70_17]|jgi:uncharacterized membrane protein|nr:MAG: hypothetical protein BRC94_01560 [Halobacteriales archaeon QS_5_70_17]
MPTPGTWKRDFASGLIVLGPLLVTLYIIRWFFVRLADLTLFGIDNPYQRVALLLVFFTLLVFSVGYLMRTTFGNVIESGIDSTMNRLPGLRVIYNASKMAVETAVAGPEDLQTPVKLEPWPGMRMTAFKTGKTTTDGRDVLFLPTAPNITTGFVIEVDPDEYTPTDETVETALTRILSAGFGESGDRGIPIDVTEEPDDGRAYADSD